ncbi:hypothetical protein BV394_05025 [Brevirhabdus pacifica]|uniref:Uncharacterized protein n=1 Tax=Brevirhabdus pacifica TaxID=1267768 RepID=A0A1U7DGU1_9RHOB|nr:DoxX family protein [Brevirhabdus pacifica]APX89155.1 hypothetical protein BV394_05025 [Brevirhabdus pacifica]OWU76787.1 membrane protein [Loktanella sp. 22II-4b]PJJ86250.1 putative oxidoreductase [Brevirhabdus pacifica]
MTTQTQADFAAAVLRITTGVLFLAHGWLKVSVFTIAGTVAFFESLGLPGIFAYLTIFAEIVGGIALILGIGTRIVSLALIPVLLGAVWAHSGFGWTFSSEGGGWEYPLFWTVVQAVVVVLGRGSFAIRVPALDRRFGQFA